MVYDAKQLNGLIRYVKAGIEHPLPYFTRRRMAVIDQKLFWLCAGFVPESHFEASYVLWLDRNAVQKLVRRARWIELLLIIVENLERCASHSGITAFAAIALPRLWKITRQMHNCRVLLSTNSVL